MTASEKYNKKMDKIFEPELNRLRKCSLVSKQILDILREKTEIDACGLTEYQLTDLVSSVIRQNYFLLQEDKNAKH